MQKLGVLLLLAFFVQLAQASTQVVDFTSNNSYFDGSFHGAYPGESNIYSWKVADDSLPDGDNALGPENGTVCSFKQTILADGSDGSADVELPAIEINNESYNSATGKYSLEHQFTVVGTYLLSAECTVNGETAANQQFQPIYPEPGNLTILDDVNSGKLRGEGDDIFVSVNFTAPYAGSLSPSKGTSCNYSLFANKVNFIADNEPLGFNDSISAYSVVLRLNRTTSSTRYNFQVVCTAPSVEDGAESVSFAVRANACENVNLSSGITKLHEDMYCSLASGHMFNFTRDNSVLDCNGFTIKNLAGGVDSSFAVLANGRRNVTVQNCGFDGFNRGISVENSTVVYLRSLTVSNSEQAFVTSGATNLTTASIVGSYSGKQISLNSNYVSVSGNGATVNYTAANSTSMNFTLDDLVKFVDVESGFVFVNSSAVPALSQAAIVTSSTVSYAGNDSFRILKDGSACIEPECIKRSTSPVSFLVGGFSNYTTEAVAAVISGSPTRSSSGGGAGSASVEEVKNKTIAPGPQANTSVSAPQIASENGAARSAAPVRENANSQSRATGQVTAVSPSGLTGLFTLANPLANGGQATPGLVVIAAILLVAGYFAIVKK